jgi:hypothetical protein
MSTRLGKLGDDVSYGIADPGYLVSRSSATSTCKGTASAVKLSAARP